MRKTANRTNRNFLSQKQSRDQMIKSENNTTSKSRKRPGNQSALGQNNSNENMLPYKQALSVIQKKNDNKQSILFDAASQKLLKQLKGQNQKDRNETVTQEMDLNLISYQSSASLVNPEKKLKTEMSYNSSRPSTKGIQQFQNFMSAQQNRKVISPTNVNQKRKLSKKKQEVQMSSYVNTDRKKVNKSEQNFNRKMNGAKIHSMQMANDINKPNILLNMTHSGIRIQEAEQESRFINENLFPPGNISQYEDDETTERKEIQIDILHYDHDKIQVLD